MAFIHTYIIYVLPAYLKRFWVENQHTGMEMTFHTVPRRRLAIFACLFLGCLSNSVVKAETVPASNVKTDVNLTNSSVVISTNSSYVTYSMFNDSVITCQVQPTDEHLRDKISTLLKDGVKIMDFTLKFPDQVGPIPGENNGTIFRPLRWVRTTGRHGRGLLLLRYDFETLSLSTLSYGVERLTVEMQQTPSGCLTNQNVYDVEKFFVDLLLNDFQSASGTIGSLSANEHICNLHIGNSNGEAEFYYMCCHRGPDENTICKKLERDIWINILVISIIVIKVFVIMYSPLLVPQAWYRLKYGFAPYNYTLKEALTLTVLKRKIPSKAKRPQNAVSISKFDEMPEFREKLKTMKEEVPYSLTFKETSFKVKYDRLVPANDVPVGIIKTLYDQIFRCKLHEKQSLKGCCEGSIFGPNNPFKRKYPWYRCLREMMRCVLFFIIALPWLTRVYVYFVYEDTELDERNYAAHTRYLRSEFLGSITLFLTPVHMIFLVCYFILMIDGIAFGILRQTVKEKFKYVLRKCFRDMREISRSRVCGWTTKIMLLPFEHCGITGLFVVALYWIPALPVIIAVLSFYWFPTLNLTVRLLAHFFAYLVPYGKESPCFRPIFACCSWIHSTFSLGILSDKESLERPETITMRYRFLQLFVILICLISMYSVVFLAMECISFFVEVGIYTLIGIILNASQTLKYLSLLFMLVLYGRDCFNGVGNLYLTFNKKILGYVVGKTTDEVKALTWLCESQQKNTAIRILPENPGFDCQNNEKPNIAEAKLKVKEGIPKWELSYLALFLDKKDTAYITRKFFFNTCYMPHHGCPGSLHKNLLKALTSFAVIIVFLLFVLFVVMAFSEDYSLSGTNQMLATLAGGLLPWLFRNILLKKPEEVTVDTDNLHFQNCFNQELKNLIQSWPVTDFKCEIEETTKKEPQSNGKDVKSRGNRYKYRTDNVTGSQIYDSADFETIEEMLPMLPEEETNDVSNVEKMNNKNNAENIDLIIDIAKEIDNVETV